MSAHTPGPWTVGTIYPTDVYGPHGLVADTNNEDDARLIASAPKMLAVLKETLDFIRPSGVWDETSRMRETIITTIYEVEGKS